MDPAGFRTALDSDYPSWRAQLQLQLASRVQIQSAHAAPESSTNRSGLLVETALTFRQISPSRNSNGISAPGFAQADTCEKTAVSGSRRNQKNTRAFCNASRRNFNSLCHNPRVLDQ